MVLDVLMLLNVIGTGVLDVPTLGLPKLTLATDSVTIVLGVGKNTIEFPATPAFRTVGPMSSPTGSVGLPTPMFARLKTVAKLILAIQFWFASTSKP